MKELIGTFFIISIIHTALLTIITNYNLENKIKLISNVHSYQIGRGMTEDTLFDGNRIVGILPCDTTSSLTKLINKDNL